MSFMVLIVPDLQNIVFVKGNSISHQCMVLELNTDLIEKI